MVNERSGGVNSIITLELDGKRFTVIDGLEDYPGDTVDEKRATLEYQWEEGNYSCDCNRALLTGSVLLTPACGNRWKLISINHHADENPSRDQVGPA